MGAGILPTTIHNGKLYFLFAKENKYADTPGYSDFGGGNDEGESDIETALREGQEETSGFLNEHDLKKLIAKGTYNITFDTYKMFMVFMPYNPLLPYYYNNNHTFMESKLPREIIQNSKIFEKSHIKWMSIREMIRNKRGIQIIIKIN